MNVKRIVAGLVLVDFAALNAYALYTAGGYVGFLEYVMEMPIWGWVVFADLVIAATMVLTWIWADAKRCGRNPVGYTLLTLAFGSIGTLLYVAVGRGEERKTSRFDSTALPAS